MNFSEAIQAIQDAKRTISAADEVVKQLGYLLPGRLKSMSSTTLKKLKKELENYNAKTDEWKF